MSRRVSDLGVNDTFQEFILRRVDISTLGYGGVNWYRIRRQAVIVPARNQVLEKEEVIGRYEPGIASVKSHFFVERCGDGTIPLGAWVVIE